VIGHQRPDKGYQHMPEAARALLAEEPDIRLLIHNGAPDEMAETQSALRTLAAAAAASWEATMGVRNMVQAVLDRAK
jgi:hypothetical protein